MTFISRKKCYFYRVDGKQNRSCAVNKSWCFLCSMYVIKISGLDLKEHVNLAFLAINGRRALLFSMLALICSSIMIVLKLFEERPKDKTPVYILSFKEEDKAFVKREMCRSSLFGAFSNLAWCPAIKTVDGGISMRTNLFEFSTLGVSNFVILAETSTDLANPIGCPLETTVLSSGWPYFKDAHETNNAARLYRLRKPNKSCP